MLKNNAICLPKLKPLHMRLTTNQSALVFSRRNVNTFFLKHWTRIKAYNGGEDVFYMTDNITICKNSVAVTLAHRYYLHVT